MKRMLRRSWAKATAWVMTPVMLVTFQSFYHVVFAEAPEKPPTRPVVWPKPFVPVTPGATALTNLTVEIKNLLAIAKGKIEAGQDASATITELDQKKQALESLKPQLDTELQEAKDKIVQQNLGPTFLGRWQTLKDTFETRFATLKSNLTTVVASPTLTNVTSALDYAKSLIPSDGPGLNTNQLPHRATSKLIWPWRPARGAPKDMLAYLSPLDTIRDITGGQPFPEASGQPTPADLDLNTPDAKVTPEIAQQSAALGNDPVRIYEFVRNTIRFESYYGSVKGASQTLREGAGNDFDQASLLIALYRAAGVPARWVYGTIVVEMDELESWLSVDAGAKAVNVLAKNDVPFEVLSNQRVRLDHAWVRAFVDYTPHRGNSNAAGDRFHDLDPSFKRTVSTPYQSVTGDVGFDPVAFLESIRKRPGTTIDETGSSVKGVDESFILSTLSGVGAKIDTFLAASGRTPRDAFRKTTIETEEFGVLPASRRYRVTTVGAAYATLPSPARYKTKFQVLKADGTVVLSYEDSTVNLAGKRITLSYKPATSDDEAAITANLGEADFPAYLVNLVPSLKVEGQEVAAGSATGMGTGQTLRITLTTPLESKVSTSDSLVVAGTYTGIAIDLSKVSANHLTERRAKLVAAILNQDTLDNVEGEILYDAALNLFFQADILNEVTANALNVAYQRDPSAALATHSLKVTPLFDLPFTAKADSVTINVVRDVLFPVARSGDSLVENQFLVTSGFATSALEHTSLVSFFVADAISTVRAITRANAVGQKIFTVTSANAATVVPQLAHPQEVKDQVASIAQAGLVVTIPQGTVLLNTVAVSAFIVLDPLLSSSAFVIKGSPSLNGGLVLTEQVKAGELLKLGPAASYQPILEAGEAWLKSVAGATDVAGLEYIATVAAIAQWFGPNTAFDKLTTVAAAIAISGPLSFIASQPGIFNVEATPAFISPNGDGVQDALTIKATVTRKAAWTVKIFQITGTGPVQVAQFTGTTADVTVVFNQVAPDGDYTFRIEAQENPPTGPTASPKGGTFKVDTTAPTATITNPVDGSTAVNLGIAFAVSGTANDPNFKSYKVEVFPAGNPSAATTLTEKTVPRVNSILAPWNTSSIENATFTAKLTVTDQAGNVSIAQSTVTITNPALDTQPPTCSITSPANNANVTGTITVAVTATDNVAVKQVFLFVDGKLVGFDATAPYEFLLDTRTIPSGTHTLIARAEDTAGTNGNPGYLADSAPVTITTSNLISSFSVNPNPFSPVSTPGVQDQTNVSAVLQSFQNYTVKIFVEDGGIVSVDAFGNVTLQPLPPGTLIRTLTGAAQFVEQPWDGRDEQGFKVLEAGMAGVQGRYLVSLSITGDSASTIVLTSPANPAPIIQIFNLAEFDDVKAPKKIEGSIRDLAGDLQSWKVELFRQGAGPPTLLAQGTTPIESGVLFEIDPTQLENDFYKIVITATDLLTTVFESREIQITGQLKIGVFTLTFTDMAVPVQGIPITVTRTYDTRLTAGQDFGTGWQLDVVAGNLKVRPADNSVVGTLPDNRRTRFLFRPIDATASLNSFTQGKLGGAVPEVFTPYRTANYEPEATQPRWRLKAQGPQDLLAIPTKFKVVNTQFGFVPVVDETKFFYYDFTAYNPPGYEVSDQLGVIFTYSNAGRLIKVEEPNGNFLTITDTAVTHSTGKKIDIVRDGTGKIVKLVDPDLKEVMYEYLAGQLSASIDRELNKTQYTYFPNGKLDKVIDPRGIQAVKNEYDPLTGRLVSNTDADGKTITFDHQIEGQQEVVTDRRGNIKIISYNDDGLVTAQTDSLGHTRSFEYDAAGNETEVRDEFARETRRTFDVRGNLLTRRDPLGNTTTFVYNDRGQVTSITDPLGRLTETSYDVSGNLIATTDALGQTTASEYDAAGRFIASVDALGTRTEFDHDPSGNVTEQRVIAGGTLRRKSTFGYDGNNRQVTQTVWKDDGTGSFVAFATTTTQYNTNGQVVKVTDPLGFFTLAEYNEIGQQKSVTDKNGNVAKFFYNSRGLLEKTELPLLGGIIPTEELGYDEEGNRTTFKDRNGHTTITVFDKNNRPEKTTHPDGGFRTTAYDASGRVLAETNERGFTTTFGYDSAGRRSSVTDALGEVTTFEFNGAGVLTAVVDANQRRTEFVPDALDRIVKTIYADGTFRSTEFDALGRRVAETDEAGIVTRFEYLPTGELSKVLQPDPADAAQLTTVTQYIYDSLGRKTDQIDALGRDTKFAYTVRNELASRTRPMGQSESFTYDPQSNTQTRTDAALVTTTYVYNGHNLLSAKLFPDGSSHAFDYFPGGQRKSFTQTPAGGLPQTTSFLLDVNNRQVQQTNPDGSALAWDYDEAGNRTKVATSFQAITYTWTPRNELSKVFRNGVEWASYSYDAVGNRASLSYVNGTRATYDYDLRNRLLKLTNLRQPVGTTTTNYLLDPDLIAAWKLEESGAPFADEEGANPLTVQGADTTASVPGQDGTGVNFGGSGAAFLATALQDRPFPSTQGTVVGFYKPNEAAFSGTSAEFFSTRRSDISSPTTGHEFRRNASDGSLAFGQVFFTPVTSGPLTWDPNQFYALTFRWGSSGGEIFRGTDLVAAGGNPIGSFPSTVNRYTVGNLGTAPELGDASGARGTLDEVALFKRKLSDQEVKDIAIRGLEPKAEIVFSSYTYTVNVQGLRTKVVDNTGRTVSYSYDSLRRLTQEQIVEGSQVTTIDYQLDKVGNRLHKFFTHPNGVVDQTDYTYNANDELLSETAPAGVTSYTYTPNGETATKVAPGETAISTWDFESRLVQVVSTTQGTIALGYDVDGIRLSKAVNGVATKFLVDKNRDYAQVVEDRNAASAVLIAYIHGDDLLSRENTTVAPAQALHFYFYDGQRSTRQLTDANASITDTRTFDAFGILLASSGSTQDNYLYTGQQLDPNLGFYYLRTRYLNPSNGRLQSRDQIDGIESEPESLHRYLYAGANPVTYFDPSGAIIEQLFFGQAVHDEIGRIFIAETLASWQVPYYDLPILTIVGLRGSLRRSWIDYLMALRRPDLANSSTHEVYEIKSENEGATAARADLAVYLAIFSRLDPAGRWHPGTSFTVPSTIIPVTRPVPVAVRQPEPGVILYRVVGPSTQQLASAVEGAAKVMLAILISLIFLAAARELVGGK